MVNAVAKTALVVDDDPDIRRLVATGLKRLGFTVTEASDGKSALKRLAEARPTLLCLDLMLPESSGFDVVEHVRKTPTLADLPVLVISARGMPNDRAAAEDLGVHAYLTKPFTFAELEAHVKLALSSGESAA